MRLRRAMVPHLNTLKPWFLGNARSAKACGPICAAGMAAAAISSKRGACRRAGPRAPEMPRQTSLRPLGPLGPMDAQVGRWRPKGARVLGHRRRRGLTHHRARRCPRGLLGDSLARFIGRPHLRKHKTPLSESRRSPWGRLGRSAPVGPRLRPGHRRWFEREKSRRA
jgi:hypothetical protein